MNTFLTYSLGCPDCGGTCLGAVSDYDIIIIGGKQYSVNQILDKTVIAGKAVKTYSSPGGTVLSTVAAGQPIGKVFSYLRPDQSKDGRSWLMFESSYNKYFYVPNEAVSGNALKDQGAKTVEQELKEEQEQKEREDNPVGFYLKKYGMPALLIIGGIVIVGGVAREAVKSYLGKKIKSKA